MTLSSSCVLCGDSVARTISLCERCQDDLPSLECACMQCGIPMNNNHDKSSICGQCIQHPSAIDYTLSLFRYEAPIAYLIGQMKFQQQLSYAAILGDLLKNRIQALNHEHGFPDALLPVPLHKKRLIERGFNQSLELVRAIAKEKHLPILSETVRRKKATMVQSHLNKKQREKNVKNCFEMLVEPTQSHIVIIDDVVTTGSTTNELAKLLKNSGVKKVGVWSVARADIDNY